MRATRAQGRPNTPIFPAGWETDHAQVIGRTHTATVTVGLPSTTGVWNPTTHQTETAVSDPIYEGVASIALTGLAGAVAGVEVVEEYLTQRKYDVTLEWDADGVTDKHVVRVTACTDPDLVGKMLRVDGVGRGSSRFARHLPCTLT